jgi:glycosyltransferase involved in cell wall biosynthesis
MRIAYISYECPPDSSNGGIATYLAQASRLMADRGHEVEVFASSSRREETSSENGVTVHWIRERNPGDFGIIAGHRFAVRHRERPFDVIEAPEYMADARKAVQLAPEIALVVRMHTPTMRVVELNTKISASDYISNLWGNTKRTISCVLRQRRIPPFEFSPGVLEWARRMDLQEREQALAADVVAAPCVSLCDYAIQSWGIQPDAVRFSPHPYTPTEEMLGYSPRQEGLVVGFVGRLERRKGVEILVEAIPDIVKAVPGVRFRFVGTAQGHPETGMPYDAWVRNALAHLNGSVEISGKADLQAMPRVYSEMDVCVFPSLWENFPNVCLEAMAAARAVIATTGGGMEEMLERGRCGVLVPPGDSKGLAEAVISLLRDPSERIRLGLLARQRLIEEYGRKRIGEIMENVFQEALDRRRARGARAGAFADFWFSH